MCRSSWSRRNPAAMDGLSREWAANCSSASRCASHGGRRCWFNAVGMNAVCGLCVAWDAAALLHRCTAAVCVMALRLTQHQMLCSWESKRALHVPSDVLSDDEQS